jgi:DNA helicase II / ATP-dependent DNA helicase PcrA
VSDKKVLNQEQIKAIKYSKGPLLIIAGAGTGKTTVITERIKYLISSGKAKPAEILALTFTEKAAMEMEERVDKIVPFGFFQMWISTFHAFGDHILRDEALNIGLDPNFNLLTQAESLMFLKNNLFEFELDYFRPVTNPNKFLYGLLTHFSRLQDEDVLPDEYLAFSKKKLVSAKEFGDKALIQEAEKLLELAKAFKKYDELKQKNGVMDFADLISKTLYLFKVRKNILNSYQQKFKYMLVDEYQDTNIAQNKLVNLLAGKKANLTVVLDDDQAIFKWRGASVSNVLDFKKNYPQAETVSLVKNYRSTQEILNRAYDLIRHNNPDRLEVKEKISKKLISVKKEAGDKIKVLVGERVEDEAQLVGEEIKKLCDLGFDFKDIAVLVRANNHANAFVNTFLRLGIPFQFLGPGRLFRQEEVLDLIAYLKLLYNFEDNVAFFRILCLPIFKLSARDIVGLRNFARKNNISLFEAAEQVDEVLVSEKSKGTVKNIIKMVHRHLELVSKQTAGQILYFFLEDTGMLKKLSKVSSKEEEDKVNNIAKFFDKLKTYEMVNEEASVEASVDWLNLKLEMGESPLATDTDWTEENKINILTVHSSKGLEFPIVFLVNLVSQRFPTQKRGDQIPLAEELVKETLPEGDSHLQEERRLFYVGMTRAKQKLYFTAAKYYGEGKRMKKPSLFIGESLGKDFSFKTTLSKKDQLSILEFKTQPLTLSLADDFSKPKITYLSFSQIQTFKRCPLQYKYSYIVKIPVPYSAPASFGTSVHQALTDFYKLKKKGKEVNEKILLKTLKNSWRKEGYISKKQEKQMFAKASTMLTSFYKKGFKKTDEPIALEQSFVTKVSANLKIGGRFDRVDKFDGKLEIIDYKTGKVKEQKEVDKDEQMSLYALAVSDPGVFAKNPEEIILSFYFLKTQEKVSTTRSKKDLEKIKQEVLKTAKEIENSDFLPNPGRYCDFCSFKLICPAWQ